MRRLPTAPVVLAVALGFAGAQCWLGLPSVQPAGMDGPIEGTADAGEAGLPRW